MRLPPSTPPPGPFRPGFWRSPLRGPWLTAALGSVLLVLVTIVAVTGFLSHAAYNPGLGGNAIVDPGLDLPLTFDWPTGPSWLYAVTQGLHTNLGLAAIPVLLAKLWSVIPRLFAWPPVRSLAQGIERLSIALLVSSAVFEFATGVLNMQYFYAFKFNFVVAHYYGAVVFVASLVLHVAVKTPAIARAYRERGVLGPLRDDLGQTRPEPAGALSSPRGRPRRRSAAAACSASWGPAPQRCCSPTRASPSAARSAASRSSRRAARTSATAPTTSRSTRPRGAPASSPR